MQTQNTHPSKQYYNKENKEGIMITERKIEIEKCLDSLT